MYTKVLELAEEQGAETMIPIARIKIGMLQFRLPRHPYFFSRRRTVSNYSLRSIVLVTTKSTPSPSKFFTIISPLF